MDLVEEAASSLPAAVVADSSAGQASCFAAAQTEAATVRIVVVVAAAHIPEWVAVVVAEAEQTRAAEAIHTCFATAANTVAAVVVEHAGAETVPNVSAKDVAAAVSLSQSADVVVQCGAGGRAAGLPAGPCQTGTVVPSVSMLTGEPSQSAAAAAEHVADAVAEAQRVAADHAGPSSAAEPAEPAVGAAVDADAVGSDVRAGVVAAAAAVRDPSDNDAKPAAHNSPSAEEPAAYSQTPDSGTQPEEEAQTKTAVH